MPILLRILFAPVLLAAAWSSAGAQSADLPATCHNPYTQQQEIELGDKVVREVYATQPVLPDSDPVAVFVRQLGARLVSAAPTTPGLERQWPFNFHVVASSEINAFALPGGTMFVNLGAIQAAHTEAQLAGVMGHEMSHVILRHSTCNLVKQQHRGLLYGLGQIGAAVALGGAGGDLAAQGIGMARNLNFLHMSRGDEKQADLLGVHIVHDAGFDPRGLPQFFEIIIAKTGTQGAQFLSDHPNPGNRTEYLNREIATLPPLQHPIVSTAAFTTAHTQAAIEPTLTAAEMKGGTWKTTGLYATGPGVAAEGPPPAPPVTGTPATDNKGTPGVVAARLTEAQLGLTAPLKTTQGGMFSIGVPGNWTRTNAANGGGFTLAPPGGTGSFGVAYGVVLGIERQQGGGVTSNEALTAASDSFAELMMQTNGLTGEGDVSSMRVGGQPATSRYLRGHSPVPVAGGASAAERDWVITVARPDGDMDTLVFVAPTEQFATVQPLFERMLNSFRPQ